MGDLQKKKVTKLISIRLHCIDYPYQKVVYFKFILLSIRYVVNISVLVVYS